MEALAIYLIEGSLILIIGVLYHKLFLRNASPRLDRVFLLGTGLAAVVLPMLHIPLSELLPGAEPPIYWMDTIAIFEGTSLDPIATSGDTLPPMFWVYAIPVAFLLGMMFYGLFQIGFRLRKKTRIRREGYTIVMNTGMGPSSFGTYLFWEGEIDQLSPQAKMVMAHEIGHIRQKHTWDLMLYEVLRMLFWFNPAVHLLYRELRQTHEFLADEAALTAGSRDSLSKVILAHAMGVPSLSMPHNFNSHIKKRIQMLAKTNSNRSRWKYLLALPLLFLAFYGTSLAQKGEPVDFETELDAVPQPTNLGEIRKRIGYPEAAIEKNVTGKVIVRLLVNKDGTVDQAEILKSPSLILSTAVGKHIEDLTFTPGRKDGKLVKTQVMIPFQFKLDPNEKSDCEKIKNK